MSGPHPAWLVAWHGQRGTQPVTQRDAPPAPAPVRAGAAAPARAAPAATPKVHPLSKGFTEPRPWDFDGCLRRGEVLDHDHHPPRVVRRVGWQRCMRCRQPFWSEDVVRLRLCTGNHGGCRDDEGRYAQGAQGEPGGSYSRYRE